MTTVQREKIARCKLSLLQLAQKLGNVSKGSRAVVLLVACGDDASKPPNQAPVAVGTPPVLEIIAEQAVTVVGRQLQALGLRDRTGPLPRSAWRSARPDRSP